MRSEWIERYGRRFDSYRLSNGKDEQAVLAQEVGEGGYRLLQPVYAKEAPPELAHSASLEMLRRIWVQQYYLEEEKLYWRSKKNQGLPPASQMIACPDEPDARYGGKHNTDWTGYKVHFTETCDPT